MASPKSSFDFWVSTANLSPQDDNIIRIKMVIIQEQDEKEVDFEFHMLEDTDWGISRELVQDLQLPVEKTDALGDCIYGSIKKHLKNREHLTIRRLFDRANVLEQEKQFGEAESLYLTLLESTKSDMEGLGSLEGGILSSLGFVQCKLSKYDDAKAVLKRQLGDFEKDSDGSTTPRGTDSSANAKVDPCIIKSLYSLARIYIKTDKTRKAERLLKRIISLSKDDSHLLDYTRRTYVKLLEKQGKLYEAELIYKRPYEERNSAISAVEQRVEKLIHSENFQEGQTLFKEALKMKEAVLPMLEALAELYIKHSKYVEALSCLSKCLELKEKLRDAEHYSLCETLNKIAVIYKLQDKNDVAELTYQKALKIAEKSLQSNENLLKMYRNANRLEDVVRTSARTQEIKKVLVATVLELASLYEGWNKKIELLAIRKRLEDINAGTPFLGGISPGVSPNLTPNPTPPHTPTILNDRRK